MTDIKIGDKVICATGVRGIVIRQYFPTACEQQTMIETIDGRKYHAPTRCFVKAVEQMQNIDYTAMYAENEDFKRYVDATA